MCICVLLLLNFDAGLIMHHRSLLPIFCFCVFNSSPASDQECGHRGPEYMPHIPGSLDLPFVHITLAQATILLRQCGAPLPMTLFVGLEWSYHRCSRFLLRCNHLPVCAKLCIIYAFELRFYFSQALLFALKNLSLEYYI